MAAKLNTGSLNFTIVQLGNQKVSMRQAAEVAVGAAGAVLYTETRRALRHRCHSLDDLRRLDHPYARRHGKIRIHQRNSWWVHTHSGRLLSAHKGQMFKTRSQEPGYQVWLDTTVAEYARFLVLGTRWMLPRDPLWVVANLEGTRKKMMQRIVSHLGRKLRSQAALRFTTATPGGDRYPGPGGASGSLSIR